MPRLALVPLTAEQEVARSMQASGLNVDKLWERKRQIIDATPGLSVWRGGSGYAQIGESLPSNTSSNRFWSPNALPRCIVWLDED